MYWLLCLICPMHTAMLIVTAPASVLAIEGGVGADVKVRLATEPIKTVTVTVAVAGSEVTVSSPSLTYSSSTWNVEQTATLEVSNDSLAAATRTLKRLVRITAASTDPFYSNVAEIQQVKLSGTSAVGGTVTLTFNSYVTAPISVSATATAVKTALEALANVYAVSVTRAANAENGFTWQITFTENGGDLPALIVDTGSMTGGGATATVTTSRTGVPPYSPAFSGEFFVTVVDDDLKGACNLQARVRNAGVVWRLTECACLPSAFGCSDHHRHHCCGHWQPTGAGQRGQHDTAVLRRHEPTCSRDQGRH